MDEDILLLVTLFTDLDVSLLSLICGMLQCSEFVKAAQEAGQARAAGMKPQSPHTNA